MLDYLPSYFTNKAIGIYFLLLIVCSVAFNTLPLIWIAFGIAEMFLFFYLSNRLSIIWSKLSNFTFQRRLFVWAITIRILWVFFSYLFFEYMNGDPFEFESADAKGYHGEALWVIGLFEDGKFDRYLKYIGDNYADMGYPLYLSTIYYFTDNSIVAVRIIKAFLSAITCVMIYQTSQRNFGESTGRMAGIMAMLLPNLIFYCGLHVKETEMVFLVVTFINYADKLLRSNKLKLTHVITLCVSVFAIYFFRTVLLACLLSSLGLGVIFVSSKIMGKSKKIVLGFGILVVAASVFSTQLTQNFEKILKEKDYSQARQLKNFSLRKDGEGGGNKLAKYGSRSIFLPLMLAAPFPTLVDTQQRNIMMLNGGFYTRNIYAFFVILALFLMIKQKNWRNHILIIAILLSYLFVLASSGFALSERFHLPILPFMMILASYGISQMNQQNKKYYIIYLLIISVVIIGWNWFKLAGRV